MATGTKNIEQMLGVPRTAAGTALGLARSVEAGLPVSAVDRLAEAVAPEDRGFKFRIVPKATLERRRKTRKLTSEEGDRVARLAKVYSLASSILADEGKVRDFLSRPHPMLDRRAPADVALGSGPGADAVLNLLGRAAYSGGV